MRKVAVFLLPGLILLFGCAPQGGPEKRGLPPGERYEASGFSIPALDGSGSQISLDEHKGKVVLLDFWATWCPPCRAELPALNKLYEEKKGEGFVLIGMTVDRGDVPAVQKAVARFKLGYPVGLAGSEAQAAYGGIRAVPTKFLLDRDGAIRKHYEGVVPEAELKADIDELLAM